MLSVEDLFLAGLGFDLAGAYLVSRGLLQKIPQLASSGGTMWSLQRPRATYAVEDRIRGMFGLVALMLGFALQAAGYAAVLARSMVHYGNKQALTGAAIALGIAVLIPVIERCARPTLRDRMLVKVARFDPALEGLRPVPLAHVLRAFGVELGKPQRDGEDDVAYCERVFHTLAEEPGGKRVARDKER